MALLRPELDLLDVAEGVDYQNLQGCVLYGTYITIPGVVSRVLPVPGTSVSSVWSWHPGYGYAL